MARFLKNAAVIETVFWYWQNGDYCDEEILQGTKSKNHPIKKIQKYLGGVIIRTFVDNL